MNKCWFVEYGFDWIGVRLMSNIRKGEIVSWISDEKLVWTSVLAEERHFPTRIWKYTSSRGSLGFAQMDWWKKYFPKATLLWNLKHTALSITTSHRRWKLCLCPCKTWGWQFGLTPLVGRAPPPHPPPCTSSSPTCSWTSRWTWPAWCSPCGTTAGNRSRPIP